MFLPSSLRTTRGSRRTRAAADAAPRFAIDRLEARQLFSGAAAAEGDTLAAVEAENVAFPIWDSTEFAYKNDLTAGFTSGVELGTWDLFSLEFAPVLDTREPVEVAVRNTARKARDAGVPLVIDIEHWKVDIRFRSRAAAQANLDRLARIADWARDEVPGLKMGFYGVAPLKDYYVPVKYYAAQRPGGTGLAAATANWNKWQEANDFVMATLAPRADFVFPSLYETYNDRAGWQDFTRGMMVQARRWNKPVIGFIWYQYHQYNQQVGLDPIPMDYWRTMLQTVRQQADGVAVWGGWDYEADPIPVPLFWDDTFDWWRELAAFNASVNGPRPLTVTATAATHDSVTVRWTDPFINETGFKVQRSTTANFAAGTVTEFTAAQNAGEYTDTGVAPETTYHYRIVGFNASNPNLRTSNVVARTTLAAPPPAPLLSANIVSSNRVDLSWTDPFNNETAFRVQRSNGNTFAPGTFTEFTAGANVTAYQDSGVQPSTTYFYRVIARGSSGDLGAASEVVSRTTPAAQPVTLTVAASAAGWDQVNVSWTDPYNNETRFRFQRSVTAGFLGGTVYEFPMAANTTSFQDTALAPSTPYWYRIIAVGPNDSQLAVSNVAAATTQASTSTAPVLSGTSASTTRIDLQWTDPYSNETAYRFQRSTTANFTAGTVTEAVLAADSRGRADGGLTPNTTYWYRVVAEGAGGAALGTSNVVSRTTVAAPNAAPVLSANVVSPTQIDVSWTDPYANEAAYRLQRSTTAGFTAGTVTDAVLGANVTSRQDTGLTAGTAYWYRVVATDAGGTTLGTSNVVNRTTPTPTLTLSANVVSPTRIDVSWNDPFTNETNYRFQRSTTAGFVGGTVTETVLAANATSRQDQGLTANTTYWYRVIAMGSGGATLGTSNIVSRTTPTPTLTLSATVVSPMRIDVSWTDPFNNETLYRFQRSLTAGFIGGTVFETVLGANVTSRQDAGLLPATSYWYRVIAMGPGGVQLGASNIVGRSTPVLPPVVPELTATVVSPTRVDLAWTDPYLTETGYGVQWSTDAAFTTFNEIAVGANATAHSLTSLTANTTYYFRVVGRGLTGDLGTSAPVSRTTPPAVDPTEPGATLPTARDVGTLVAPSSNPLIFNDRVDSADPVDIYKFVIDAVRGYSITLSNMTANADLQIIYDADGNGQIDPGDAMRTSAATGTATDSIKGHLLPGTYYARVFRVGTAATNYKLTLSSSATTEAPNTLAAAKNLGTFIGTRLHRDAVAGADADDVYKFALSARSTFSMALEGLGDNADVELIRDGNNNKQVDAGELLQSSASEGSQVEAIGGVLSAGTYYVRVRLAADADPAGTNYNLGLFASGTSDPGATLAAARNTGNWLGGNRIYRDTVGGTDTNDYYRFALIAADDVTMSLSGLGANADLQLIRDANNNKTVDAGDVLVASARTGSAAESIAETLNAGTYYVRVYTASGVASTAYNLAMHLGEVPVPPPTAPELAGSAFSHTRVDLTWTDPFADESGYIVQRSATKDFASFTVVSTRPANATSFSDTGLAAATAYHYRVVANRGAAGQAASNVISVTTLPEPGQAVTLTATADGYVRDGTHATTRFGTGVDLEVKKSSTSYNREAYIKFDLTTLTGIANAKLRLYGRLNDNGGANVATSVYGASNANWSETTLTWQTKPAATTASLGNVVVANATAAWYELDVTAFLVAEKAAGRTTVTFVLRNPATSLPQTLFAARESGATAPQLVVTT